MCFLDEKKINHGGIQILDCMFLRDEPFDCIKRVVVCMVSTVNLNSTTLSRTCFNISA